MQNNTLQDLVRQLFTDYLDDVEATLVAHTHDYDSLDVLIAQIRELAFAEPIDQVHAHYDAQGRLTADPEKIRSTLLVRRCK